MADLADHHPALADHGRPDRRRRGPRSPRRPRARARSRHRRTSRVGRSARSSPGGPPTSRPRSRPPEAPRRAARAVRGRRRGAGPSRRDGRRPASRSDVIEAARSGGKSARGPVGVDADADDGARVVRAEAVGLAQHAGDLADGAAGLEDEVVGPLEAGSCRRAGRRRPRRPRPSPATRSRPAATCRRARARPGRNPSDARSAAPGGASQRRPSRPRPAVCSSATARQTSGVPVGQPLAHDVVGRADALEALVAGEERRHRHVALTRRPRTRRRPPRAARARTRRGARAAPSRDRPRRSCT